MLIRADKPKACAAIFSFAKKNNCHLLYSIINQYITLRHSVISFRNKKKSYKKEARKSDTIKCALKRVKLDFYSELGPSALDYSLTTLGPLHLRLCMFQNVIDCDSQNDLN